PLPTIWTCSGSTPVDSWKTSETACSLRSAAGRLTLVPPSKSSERVNPRIAIAAIATTNRPTVMEYHVLDRLMKSNPPSSRKRRSMREILVFFAAMIISPPGSPDPRAWRSSNPRFRVYRMPQTPPHSWMQVLQRFEVYLLVLRLQAHHQ